MLQRVYRCIARVASRQAIARPVAMRGCDNRAIAGQCVTAGALAPLHLQHNAVHSIVIRLFKGAVCLKSAIPFMALASATLSRRRHCPSACPSYPMKSSCGWRVCRPRSCSWLESMTDAARCLSDTGRRLQLRTRHQTFSCGDVLGCRLPSTTSCRIPTSCDESAAPLLPHNPTSERRSGTFAVARHCGPAVRWTFSQLTRYTVAE